LWIYFLLSLYTSQSSPKLLMKPICTNSVTIILVIEQPLLTTRSFPNKDNNRSQSTTTTNPNKKRQVLWQVCSHIVGAPSSPPPFPLPSISQCWQFFFWYNFVCNF
jgi:hypothetical protein